MIAIYKREMTSYFTTPIGYVFVAIFLAISGALFAATTLFEMTNETGQYFSYMLFMYVLLVPLLTMKSFSEERKTRTEQLLLTAPVSLVGMVMAKFLAAMTLFVGCQGLGALALFILGRYSAVKVGVVLASVLGLLLVGMAFITVGLFVSALTENQLAAAVGTVGILLAFLLISFVNQYINVYWIRFVLNCLSMWSRFQNFLQGTLDLAAIFYYLSVAAVFLFLTVRIYDKRRYN
ncbi:MAG: ABC transporter permease [Clostridia bacterium]|nr:ABC transporter permease [Clostridia bacterium]